MSVALLLLGLAVATLARTADVAVAAANRLELVRWLARRLDGADAAAAVLARPGDLSSAAGVLAALGVATAGVAAPWALADSGIAARLVWVVVIGLPVLALVAYHGPKAVGRRWPEPLVRLLVPFLRYPAALVARVRRRRAVPRGPGAGGVAGVGGAGTPGGEFAALFDDAAGGGLAREDELAVLTGVMAFSGRPVREVMTSRTRIVAAPESASAAELARLFVASGYTRLAVYRASLDEIVGMVHAFDLIKAGPDGRAPVRPVAYLPGSRRSAEALLDLRREGRQLAVVLDEFGGTAGLVTLEDLLKELVDEIFPRPASPFRYPIPAGAVPPRRAESGNHGGLPLPGSGGASGGEDMAGRHLQPTLVVEGSYPLADINRHFGTSLAAPPKVETVGGFLAWAAGCIPPVGSRFESAGLEFDVLDATPSRLGRLVVRRSGPARSLAPAPRGSA